MGHLWKPFQLSERGRGTVTCGMKRRYRNHQKGGGLFSAIEHQQSYTQRKTGILKALGLHKFARGLLGKHTGVSFVRRLTEAPEKIKG